MTFCAQALGQLERINSAKEELNLEEQKSGATGDRAELTARASGFTPFSIRETQKESCWRVRFVFYTESACG
jgi:hypothetical protein